MGRFVKLLQRISANDINDAGTKATYLGWLARAGFNVPSGCCIPRSAYAFLKEYNGLQPRIDELLSHMIYDDLGSVEKTTSDIRKLITSSSFPPALEGEVSRAVSELSMGGRCFLAVRVSFAPGNHQYTLGSGASDPFCFLRGKKSVLQHMKICWSYHWSSKAALDRYFRNAAHDREHVVPIIQRMVDSRVSGILFTRNLEHGSKNEIRIEANWGLGNTVVSGRSMQDLYTLRRAGLALKEKRIVKKTVVAVFDEKRGVGSINRAVDSEMMDTETLTNAEIRTLGEVGLRIEGLFGSPQEIAWAFEGPDLFILGSHDIRYGKEKKRWDKEL
ncbi:MAG: hypothetical protein JXL84_00215 [Deltaproteobacteria bacterium]|nr:hypothetical protein [Deltaproteobacteria bacterium]